jgi:hypothetical protein
MAVRTQVLERPRAADENDRNVKGGERCGPRRPNGSETKLCGQGPRAEAERSSRLRRACRDQRRAKESRRLAALRILIARGASAPNRSRAAAASVSS